MAKGEIEKELDPFHQAALATISAAVVLGDRDALLARGHKLLPDLLKITEENERVLRKTVDQYGMDALNKALDQMNLSRLTDMPAVRKIYSIE